jgi:ankyrin repeat protein
MKLTILTFLVVYVFGGVAADRGLAQTTALQIDPSRIAARKELGQLGVEYSRDSFIKVAREGDTIAVQLLIQAGMPPDVMDKDGMTALAAAAFANQTETVRALIAGGAGVETRTKVGFTALWMATDADQLEAVKQLLDSGADPNEAGALFKARSRKELNVCSIAPPRPQLRRS